MKKSDTCLFVVESFMNADLVYSALNCHLQVKHAMFDAKKMVTPVLHDKI